MNDGDKKLREKINAAFHRCRTRALRGAEVRLDHITEAENDVLAAVHAFCEQRERKRGTIEIPNLEYFQITAYKNNEQHWKSPLYHIGLLPIVLKSHQPGGEGDDHANK